MRDLVPGDKLFHVFNGRLEVAVFMEESLAGPDCSVTTFVLRYVGGDRAGRKFRCSKGMYCRSELEAWERYVGEVEACVPEAEKAVEAAVGRLEEARDELVRARAVVVRLGGGVRVEDVFTCPSCGAKRLEEVLGGVVQSSVVTHVAVTEAGVACEYGAVSHDGGEVLRYVCGCCGVVIADSEEGLVAFLKLG